MAWVEKTGKNSWRVRYPKKTGGTGSVSGFGTKKAAYAYANDLETDRRRGIWIDPTDSRTTVADWTAQWFPTLDVDPRTIDNYRSYLTNHILPHWGTSSLGEITALDVTAWIKQLRCHLAASTVNCVVCVFAMLMDDAVDQHLIPANPVRRRPRRGRRCDRPHPPTERVWTTPEKVLRAAEQAGMLGGPDAKLLVITTAWTGCRWGEMAGLQPHNVDLIRRVIIIDDKIGALHESAHTLWLGPPKTPSSARTIPLPPFLVELLREHLARHTGQFVFTSPLGYPLRRSDFHRRVFRPAVDGNQQHPNANIHTEPVQPGLTFHGLRHSHKTWMIADGIPEIAQAKRLGHHLSNRLVETYSHVAPEIETRLLRGLEQRWQHATHARRPTDNRPRRSSAAGAHHMRPARRSTPRTNTVRTRPSLATTRNPAVTSIREEFVLPNSSTMAQPSDHRPRRVAIIARIRKALRPGKTWTERL